MKNSLGAFVVLIAALCLSGSSSAVSESPYVTFVIMGPQGFGPSIINGIVQPEALWHSTKNNSVEEIKKVLGEQHDGQPRYVGFSVALTPTAA